MNNEQNLRYRDILIAPVRECANYTPKFGHGQKGGFTLSEFLELYGADPFYNMLGLDNRLLYSAHKAAGGLTSIYRQIGIGCERLVRAIFMDYLNLDENDVRWSYTYINAKGKKRKRYLDGRIIINNIQNYTVRSRCDAWITKLADSLDIPFSIRKGMQGVVFEVRQGYKSKDSKRQNADIANASNAYAKGYIPCLMVISSQIDDDIVARYRMEKWAILRGFPCKSITASTYAFFEQVINFNFMHFMSENHDYFKQEIYFILRQLIKPE